MALAATIVWEVRTGGADTNGGGFKTGATGTDWTLQDAAQYAVTDGVTAGTTTITSATANFGTDVVGNVMYVQGGTGSVAAGWYEITARTNSTTITVDRSTGLTAGTGVTLNIGGALVSPGVIGAVAVSGNTIYIKNGTYSISSSSNNVSGGVLNTTNTYSVIGYSTNRTKINTDTKPVIQFGTSGITFSTIRGLMRNLAIDANSQTTAKASGAETIWELCTFVGINVASGNAVFVFCTATGCSAAVFTGALFGSEAYGNTATPILPTASAAFCLSYDNTGASTDGFGATANAMVISNCVSYGNGRSGFGAGGRQAAYINCHAEANGGWGFNIGTHGTRMMNCSGYNNTSGLVTGENGADVVTGTITVTDGTVFVDGPNDNYALNSTALRGALLRAAGLPGAFPSGLTTGYLDIGAAQHADPAGGGQDRVMFVEMG